MLNTLEADSIPVNQVNGLTVQQDPAGVHGLNQKNYNSCNTEIITCHLLTSSSIAHNSCCTKLKSLQLVSKHRSGPSGLSIEVTSVAPELKWPQCTPQVIVL